MAFKKLASYPTQIAQASGYPGGKAKNKVSSNDTTGTPFEAQWVNDIWGFLDALLGRGAIVRSGVPDTSIASDYAKAIDEIARYWVMQAFNPSPRGTFDQPKQGRYRRSLPLNSHDASHWRWVSDADGGSRNARLWLYHHTVATMGSTADFLRQPIDFPVPRLKITGLYATFENAGDMKIRIDKRRRLENASESFTVNVLTLDADDYSGTAIEAYQAVSGTIEQNPDTGDTWEYVLTVEASATSGSRLSNIAIEYQWMPLDSGYAVLLAQRANAAKDGATSWG